MSIEPDIPVIDVGVLFGAPTPQRDRADRAVMGAAARSGFFVARGFPAGLPIGRRSRAELLRLFQLSERDIHALWRRKFDSSHANVYRGWFPLQKGFLTSKEGIDLGPDVAYGPSVVCAEDPLREATPLPPEAALPGWRDSVSRYYRGMVQASAALMRSIARGLMLPEQFFDHAFDKGL